MFAFFFSFVGMVWILDLMEKSETVGRTMRNKFLVFNLYHMGFVFNKNTNTMAAAFNLKLRKRCLSLTK